MRALVTNGGSSQKWENLDIVTRVSQKHFPHIKKKNQSRKCFWVVNNVSRGITLYICLDQCLHYHSLSGYHPAFPDPCLANEEDCITTWLNRWPPTSLVNQGDTVAGAEHVFLLAATKLSQDKIWLGNIICDGRRWLKDFMFLGIFTFTGGNASRGHEGLRSCVCLS